jgi:3-hydroxyacyl-CoA dehydrogenase
MPAWWTPPSSSPEEFPRSARCPRCGDLKARHPNADAYFQFARNMVGGMSKNFPAPLRCPEAVAGAVKLKFDDGMRASARVSRR